VSSPADQERGLSKWTLKTGVWILAGFLLVTIALILSAREEERNFPSVTNTRASGYAALAELIQRDGYDLVLDRSVRPKFDKSDVLFITSFDYSYSDQADSPFAAPSEPQANPYQTAVLDHLAKGGRVIEVFNSTSFRGTSDLALMPRVAEPASEKGKPFTINVPYGGVSYTSLDLQEDPYDAWAVDDNPFISFYKVGPGRMVTVADGIFAANRFLDDQENAAFFLAVLHTVAPPGSKIVVLEAGIGNADDPSAANTLGTWAEAARWQAVLLFVVLVFTLGRRFGLPIVERRRVRGSRELFDAIADVFRRTGNTTLALDNLLAECETRVRKTLNMGPKGTRKEMFAHVPAALKDQFFKVAEFASLGARAPEAAREAAKLLALLEAFEKDSRASRGLKR
jgi:hypothetical protein